jgi:copper homeostasis protein
MARPRNGSYEYTAAELNLLADEVQRLRDAGAHGVVFGVVTGTRTIDENATRRLVDVCAGADAVFHRVFDETPDPTVALDTLIHCGITRLLTSGHAPSAIEGVATLARLQRHAAGRIAILPGGSVRAGNVREIVRRAAVTQVHARGSQPGVIAALRQALDASPAA